MSDLLKELCDLEQTLWEESTRFDVDYMELVCSEDFFEFGRSGRIFTREQTLARPRSRITVVLPLIDYTVTEIADGVCLATYITESRVEVTVRGKRDHKVEYANRSSLWRKANGRWQLCFHQGTPS